MRRCFARLPGRLMLSHSPTCAVQLRSSRAPRIFSSLSATRPTGSRPKGSAPPEPELACYFPGMNMMCAFGVPGSMIHGAPFTGSAVRPTDPAVAYGM